MSHPPIRFQSEALPSAAAILATGVAFVALYAGPIRSLAGDWLSDPDASHALLLVPIAFWYGWKSGLVAERRASPVLGTLLLTLAVLLGALARLAAELYTLRLSIGLAAVGLVVYAWGVRQLLHWWLPAGLLLLSVPLPATVLATVALPLQLKASQIGAGLLQWRHVPVRLSGNVIHIPGQSLFVTEACSGLRSMTALLALGLLIGAMSLRTAWLRGLLLAISIPLAILTNGIRVFLTGFLIYFVDPALGEDVMHYTEGWVLFVVSFIALTAAAWVLARADEQLLRLRARVGTTVQRLAPRPTRAPLGSRVVNV